MQKKIALKKIHGLAGISLASQVLKGRAITLAFAFMGCAFGFFCLSAYVQQVNRTHIIPYLVTVDSHGVVLSQGEVDPSFEVPQEVVAATLANFISNLRQVSSDPNAQKEAILKVYAHVKDGDEAQKRLDEHYKTHNPFEEGKKKRVEVRISNVLAQSPQALQIDWHEKTITNLQSKEKKLRAQVFFKVEKVQDLEAQKLLLNPLSIYVTDFVISEIITDLKDA